jgi:hypothetical protein
VIGASIATTLTETNGYYEFTELEAGDYEVYETNNPAIAGNVDDKDQGPAYESFNSRTNETETVNRHRYSRWRHHLC